MCVFVVVVFFYSVVMLDESLAIKSNYQLTTGYDNTFFDTVLKKIADLK